MNDREIDDVLEKAAQASQPVSPALMERIAGSIKPSMRPVRPMPPAWLLTGYLILISSTVALAGAARAGFFGVERLGAFDRALIFLTVGIFIWAAASEFVSSMIPGSKRRVHPWALMSISCLTLMCIFAGVFHDDHTDHFVSAGVACLSAGVLHAIPIALVSWLLLRRGFATQPVLAGVVAGTLAGLGGLLMLELHCPNFQAPHVLVWHTAVVPVSAGGGALAAWLFHARARSRIQ